MRELARQINLVYDALIGDIEQYGGSVISFAGDAVTCWFDDADGNGPAPLRAATCAFALQKTMQKFPRLGIKVAIATGPVRRFIIGDPDIHYIDALAGDTVSRTAIGEHFASRGDVIVDEATVEALGQALTISEWRKGENSSEKYGVVSCLSISAEPIGISPLTDINTLMLRPYIHPTVYEREVSGLGSFLTEFRPCVALFLRFEGIDYDADDAQKRLDGFVRKVQAVVSRHGGAVLQLIIGDKGSYLYINFGVLSMHEDDAQRAMRAAIELREIGELSLQTGITKGVMRVGTYGGSSRCTYGALGDDVNLSARLMMGSEPGEILVSSAIQKATDQHYTFEPRPPQPMKGKAEPVPVFVVTGIRQQRAMRLQEPIYSLPMVGRRSELKLIEEKFDLTLLGQSQVIGITAEAGLGKSRLVAEAIRSARKKGFTGYGGSCQSDGIHTPYLPWRSILNAFFDVDPYAPARKTTRMLEMEIEDRAPKRINALPLLGNLLGISIPDNDFTRLLEPKIRQSALHALLDDCLKSAAGEEPLLIVIEDFHWIDMLSHDLMEELSRTMAKSRVCFIIAYRPLGLASQLAPRLRALPQFTPVELHELDVVDAAQAIRAKLSQLYPARSADAVSPALVEKLMSRSQGNPFFLEELLNYLHDRGLDPRDPAALNKIELPQNLHTLILSRLDQLIERQKTILRVASILGRVFPVSWLTGYYPGLGSTSQVIPDLDEMQALEITSQDASQPELTYFFKHVILHEVTYESLPYDTRIKLHEKFAKYLETVYLDAPPLDTLAFHYGRSENKAKQCEFLMKAGEAAQRNFANEAALTYFNQLLPLLQDPIKILPVHMKKGELLEHIGKLDEAENEYRAALKLVAQTRDAQATAHAQFALGKLKYWESKYDEALEWLDKARKAYMDLDDDAGHAKALNEIGKVFWRKGEYEPARDKLNKSLELAQRAGDRKEMAKTLSTLGSIARVQGDNQNAKILFEQGLALYRELGDKDGIASLLNGLGTAVESIEGSLAAKALYEEALAIDRETGNRIAIVVALNNLGMMAFALEDYQTAQKNLEECLEISRELSDKCGIASALCNLGIVALAQGDAKKSKVLHEQSREIFVETGEKSALPFVICGIGMALIAQNDPALLGEARRHILESLRMRMEMGEQGFAISSLIGMAWYYLANGETLEAGRMLGAVNGILKRMHSEIEPDILPFYNRVLNETRIKLGDAFESAWAEGAKLSIDEAVKVACAD